MTGTKVWLASEVDEATSEGGEIDVAENVSIDDQMGELERHLLVETGPKVGIVAVTRTRVWLASEIAGIASGVDEVASGVDGDRPS